MATLTTYMLLSMSVLIRVLKEKREKVPICIMPLEWMITSKYHPATLLFVYSFELTGWLHLVLSKNQF